MALTREFRRSVTARMQRDRIFRKALLVEGVQALLDGDVESGKTVLRQYIRATGGFERLGREAGIPAKSLLHMFGKSGDPAMVKLVEVLLCLEARDKIRLRVRAIQRR